MNNDDFFKMPKMPSILKVLIGGLFIAFIWVWFENLQITGPKMEEVFFRNEVNSKVIRSSSFYGRSEEFNLDNGMKLYFMPSRNHIIKLRIGDSISKPSDTFTYDVFRKNETGDYEYFATYQGDRVH